LGPQIANPQIAKIYGSHIANLQIDTFEEFCKSKKNEVLKVADCDLWNLSADRLPLQERDARKQAEEAGK
jgi:hypothetical protein